MKRPLKNAGTIHFKFGGRFGVSQMGKVDGLYSTLADFSRQIKGRQNVERKVFYTSHLPKNEEITGVFCI